MGKSYKVSVFAGTKVVADMAQQVKNATIEASIQVKTIKGGATSATATILPPGPAGANRKMEDVEGWFVNGTTANPPTATGTPWEAKSGLKNINWWDASTGAWSLGSSVPLPKNELSAKAISIQQFDKKSFRQDTSILSDGRLSPSFGAQTTFDIKIPRDNNGKLIYNSVSFYGLFAGQNKRMRFLSENGSIITPIPSAFSSSKIQSFGEESYYVTVMFRSDKEPIESDPKQTFMLCWGNALLPYEEYRSDIYEIEGKNVIAASLQKKDGNIIKPESIQVREGFLKVFLSSTLEKWYVRIPFNDNYDLFHTWQIDPINLIPEFNKVLKLPVTTVDNEDVFASNQTIKGAEDDICPIRFENNYLLGGGHGATVRNVTISHNKTADDLLSIWNDGGRQWRLIQIVDSNTLKFIPLPYNTANGTWVNPALVTKTLTHVSGAVNTSSIDANNSVTTGIDTNTMPGRVYKLLLDNKTISEPGLYLGNEFKVYDQHTIVDIRNLKAQIPFKINEGSELFSEKITYKYDKYNNCVVDYVIDSKSSVFIEQHGFAQFSRAITGVEGAGETLLYIPDSGPISNGTTTFDLASTPVNIYNPLGGSLSLDYNPSNIPDINKPVFRVVQLQQTAEGIKKNGFAHGFSIDLGVSKNANRKSLSTMWQIRNDSAKSYPSGIRKFLLTPNTVLQGRFYRSIFNAELNPDFTAVYFYKEDEKFVLYLDAHQTLNKKTVNLHPDLISKKITIKQTGGSMTLLTSDYIPDSGQLIISCNTYGYLILELL